MPALGCIPRHHRVSLADNYASAAHDGPSAAVPSILSTHVAIRKKPSPLATHFKHWAKPGPIPPGARGDGPQIQPGESLDAISGYFRIFQLTEGHRFSTDDVLTAWYGTCGCPSARRVLDLGSGIGTVGMIAAWRLPGAHFVTIEAQQDSLRLAIKSRAWNGLEDRYDIRQGDLRDPDVLAPDEQFDLILGSPPYFPLSAGVQSSHPQRVACRFEVRGTIADYCKTAVAHLAPGGVFACVFPIRPDPQHQRVRDAASAAGLTILRHRPIILRAGEEPLLGLFLMIRATDIPETMRDISYTEPALLIRQKDGKVSPEYTLVKMSFGFPP